MMKFAVQLEKPATAMAAGLGPCENSSATKNQGMGPGPTSKKATKPKMDSILMLLIHGTLSCQVEDKRVQTSVQTENHI